MSFGFGDTPNISAGSSYKDAEGMGGGGSYSKKKDSDKKDKEKKDKESIFGSGDADKKEKYAFDDIGADLFPDVDPDESLLDTVKRLFGRKKEE